MKKIMTFTACAGVLLLGQGILSQTAMSHTGAGDGRTLQQTKTLTLDAGKISELVIEAGAGSMEIKSAEVDAIEVTAKVYQERAHDNYCLSLTRENNQALLESATCRDNRFSNDDTSIDLTVLVPKTLALDIHDGSGFIKIDGVAAAKIADGSGYIDIANVAGAVDINDGSGLITARNIDNNLDITDGSGAIDVQSVDGDLVISDGSGSIDVASVTGKVVITDGSGSISVSRAGRFELLADGSGGVDVSDISGEVVMNGHGR
ncbi:DUF4097 family beta strand repeat protein [Thalassomonas viridans]|uniref:DUF4097 family beta strand repeat protein n=1 Tax=Thalassomonas viridans TaxID=137584 RepID=A0AAF0C7X2_9GAMM|nr:DUF4097 family beta strand repeat-containing protein [Thalassomonas viridans]WDE03796.1 DUF4097 family beta strand repeat protein [Thalassomonas viridans]